MSKLSSKKQILKLRKVIQKAEQQIEEVMPIINQPTLNREITIVLEQAVLQVGRLKSQNNVLLNFESHSNYIKKRLNRKPEDFRTDIIHLAILTLFDSTLNKAGCLRVLIHTEDKQVIEIDKNTKIPRTYKRFAGMLCKLLITREINYEGQILAKVHTDSIQDILKDNYIIGTSIKGKQVDLKEISEQNKKYAFVVGAVAVGHPGYEANYINECIQISRYPLSTSNCLSKITDLFEQQFDIL